MAEFSKEDLYRIFEESFRANPGAYHRVANRGLEDFEESPAYRMLESSPALNYVRQRLPENVGRTAAGQWLLEQLPQNEDPSSAVSKLRRIIEQAPLGGYDQRAKAAYQDLRDIDPEVRANTVEVGRVPTAAGEVPTGDSFRAAAAQGTGVLAGDLASEGLRNIWWFLNAPQALAQIATMQAIHNAGADYRPTNEKGEVNQAPFLKNRTMRMAATLPAVIGMSMAVGNAGRMPGYKAAVPSEADPTVAADPLAELGARFFLGRTGALLPYEEFVQERPDVSRGEYESYKAYLHGSSWPLKATLEGIHGPEVTFMGKSIPVATGVLPAIAAVYGARKGVRKAAARLAGDTPDGVENKLQLAQLLKDDYKSTKRRYERPRDDEEPATQEELDQAYREYNELQIANESEVLKQALLYSGGYMGGTAIAGQALESLRRAMAGRAPVEDPDPELKPLQTIR